MIILELLESYHTRTGDTVTFHNTSHDLSHDDHCGDDARRFYMQPASHAIPIPVTGILHPARIR